MSRTLIAAGKAVTIKEVAALARVSVSTASVVLNGRAGAAQEVRRRVLAAADEIGFRPNRAAQALRVGRGQHIGMLVPDFANPFYSELVAGVMSAARRYGRHIFVAQGSADPADRPLDFETLAEARCAGLILLDVIERDRASVESLLSEIPIVQVIRRLDGLAADAVGSDERNGAVTAVQHMISCGHREVAIIAGPQTSSASRDRLEGYRAAMEEARLALRPDRLAFGDLTRGSGYALAQTLLATKPEAIVCGNDLLALGAIDAIMDAGLRVPDDVAIIGYDDMAFASARPIGLTTIHQPLLEIGESAVALLASRMETPDRAPEVISLPYRLVVRRSCGSHLRDRATAKPTKRQPRARAAQERGDSGP
jgi:LacI family transcriptional regulator